MKSTLLTLTLATLLTSHAVVVARPTIPQPATPKPLATAHTPSLLGPAVGHVSPNDAFIWARAAAAGSLQLRVFTRAGAKQATYIADALAASDLCVKFHVLSLEPDTEYLAVVTTDPSAPDPARLDPALPGTALFHTPADHAKPCSVTIMFGSCEMDPWDKPQPIWSTIDTHKPDALCLIGDTPYIDSTDLDVQRRRYREFFSNPQFLALRAHTPCYAVWDDHDFGKNDTDGNLPGKQNALQAFGEYHANAFLGENALGAYSSFRTGPMEVFLIDARWFSGTEPSFADPDKKTLLGRQQWAWLQQSLQASTAPFKLLVTGMVWNDAVRPNKTDYWGAYPYERNAVFAFLADNHIPGVVLIGGDVHRSRAFKNPSAKTGVPYPLYEFVISPLGDQVHANAEVPHPDLLFDRGEPRAFLLVTADTTKSPPTLTARWINAQDQEYHKIETTLTELK